MWEERESSMVLCAVTGMDVLCQPWRKLEPELHCGTAVNDGAWGCIRGHPEAKVWTKPKVPRTRVPTHTTLPQCDRTAVVYIVLRALERLSCKRALLCHFLLYSVLIPFHTPYSLSHLVSESHDYFTVSPGGSRCYASQPVAHAQQIEALIQWHWHRLMPSWIRDVLGMRGIRIRNWTSTMTLALLSSAQLSKQM